MPLDVEVVRRTLLDHLADRVLVVDDRAGIPFVIDAVSGKPGSFRPALCCLSPNPAVGNAPSADRPRPEDRVANWPRASASISTPRQPNWNCGRRSSWVSAARTSRWRTSCCMEGDRDPGPRGQRMRKLGLTIIESLIRIVPMSPLPPGKASTYGPARLAPPAASPRSTLRATAEDMRTMVDMYRRERAHGREHPEWFNWVKAYSDWLLTAAAGGWVLPRTLPGRHGKSDRDASGATSYAPVPVLVRMSEETGDKKIPRRGDQAPRTTSGPTTAASACSSAQPATTSPTKSPACCPWRPSWRSTKTPRNRKWLERAETAGSYTESWIWIWNVPMPIGRQRCRAGLEARRAHRRRQRDWVERARRRGRVPGLGRALLRQVVQVHQGRALPGCRARPPARHQEPCWRCPDAPTTCWAPAGSRNTGGWDRASEALAPTAPGCRGFPSTTCTASRPGRVR